MTTSIIPKVTHEPLYAAEKQVAELTARLAQISEDYKRVANLADPKSDEAKRWVADQAKRVLDGQPLESRALPSRDALQAEHRVVTVALTKAKDDELKERRVYVRKVLDAVRPGYTKRVQAYALLLAKAAIAALDEGEFFDELRHALGVSSEGWAPSSGGCVEPVGCSVLGNIRDVNSVIALWFREMVKRGSLTPKDDAIKLLRSDPRIEATLGMFLEPKKGSK